MVELSRRFFLGGALALAAVTAVPITKLLKPRPIIFGDGILDDTEGLQAFLDGAEVDIREDAVRVLQGEGPQINGGRFLTSGTLIIRRDRTIIQNCRFIHSSTVDCLFRAEANAIGIYQNVVFQI